MSEAPRRRQAVALGRRLLVRGHAVAAPARAPHWFLANPASPPAQSLCLPTQLTHAAVRPASMKRKGET